MKTLDFNKLDVEFRSLEELFDAKRNLADHSVTSDDYLEAWEGYERSLWRFLEACRLNGRWE